MDSISSCFPSFSPIFPNCFSDKHEDIIDDRIINAASEAFYEMSEKFKELGNEAYQYIANHEITKTVLQVAQRIVLFIRRHKWVFITYAISLGLMIAMGATGGQIAAAIIPGLIWTLVNVKGELLPEDLLIPGRDPELNPTHWLPENLDQAQGSAALTRRMELMEEANDLLKIEGEQGWALLHGEPRIGKSVLAAEILRRAEENGQEIFRLSKEINNPEAKNAFITITEYLNEQPRQPGKPPILFIDEFSRVPQALFAAIYESNINFNILAVQSNLTATDFHVRFKLMEVPRIDPIDCILTLSQIYQNDVISAENIEKLVKELACRLGAFDQAKLLNESIKAITRAQKFNENVLTWDALSEAIKDIVLDKRNYIELLPKIQPNEFMEEEKNSKLEVFQNRQKIIDECANILPRSWVYLNSMPRTHSEPCINEIIRKVQEKGHDVYSLNKFYFEEKNKSLSVNKYWETIYETLEIITKNSPKSKPPIFFLENNKNPVPADIFRKIFENAPFRVFVFEEKEQLNSGLTNLFIQFQRKLPELSLNDIMTILRKKYRQLPDSVIDLIFVSVKKNIKAKEIENEFYLRAERILSNEVQMNDDLSASQNLREYLSDLEKYINLLDWNECNHYI